MVYNKFKIYFLPTINGIYVFERITRNIFINIGKINNIINIFIINKKIKDCFLGMLWIINFCFSLIYNNYDNEGIILAQIKNLDQTKKKILIIYSKRVLLSRFNNIESEN
jgi:hypothetical protein